MRDSWIFQTIRSRSSPFLCQQVKNIAYTVIVKNVVTLSLTICLAVVAGIIVSARQKNILIEKLLKSPAVKDQLDGISMLSSVSFDKLAIILANICDDNTAASKSAQRLLVQKAFHEDRIIDLQQLTIDEELYESALWWNEPHPQGTLYSKIVIHTLNPSPWVVKLLAHYDSMHHGASYPNLLTLPLRDRDGSVLLSVLAIHKHAPEKIDNLISSWSLDYDIDRQKAAILLSAMKGLPPPAVSSENAMLLTLQSILHEKNFALAWRSMHKKDGTIDPDFALSAMIIDPKRFTPMLAETAVDGKWTHPEHAILIAETFVPDITNKISMLDKHNRTARRKWWSIFTCGLLHKEG